MLKKSSVIPEGVVTLKEMSIEQRLNAHRAYQDSGGTWKYSEFLAYMWGGYFNIETGLPVMITLEDFE